MGDDLDLGHLVDPQPEPAGVEGLRAIVSRARRRAAVGAVAGAMVVLAAGGAGGYLLAGGGVGGHPPTVAAGAASRSVAHAPASGSTSTAQSSGAGHGGTAVAPGVLPSGACAVEVPGPPVTSSPVRASQCRPAATSYRHLFTRTTAAGVTIRAFTVPCEGCASAPGHVVEVSTSSMVAVTGSSATAAATAPGPLGEVSAALGGTAEGDPVAVVSATASSGVARVTWSVKGVAAGDSMVPHDGFVALAVPVAPGSQPVGTLEALDASGHVLARQQVDVGVPTVVAPATTVAVPGAERSVPLSTTTTTAPTR